MISVFRSAPLLAAVVVASLISACGSSSGTGESEPGNSNNADNGCPSPDDRLVAAAQQEGTVVWTGTPAGDVRELVSPAFEERYGVKVEYVGARNSETAAKLRAERAAGIYSHDVFTGGGDTMSNVYYAEDWLASLKDALALEILADEKWLLGKTPWVDPEREKMLKLSEYMNTQFVINTDVVGEGEVTTWEDLLDPKWKGKIVVDDPRSSGGGANDVGLLLDTKGEEFVADLYKRQEPVYMKDAREEIDAVAQGKYAIGLSVHPAQVAEAIETGLPVKLVVPDDVQLQVTSGSGLLAMNNKAPHPNAAKLLVNYLACDEGNELWNQATLAVPTRKDVEMAEGTPESQIPKPGVDYFDSYSWEFLTEGKQEAQDYMTKLLG